MGGRPVPFPELHAMGMFDSEHERPVTDIRTYDALGLEWRENSSVDILDFAVDMMDRLEGREPPPEARRLQEAYERFLPSGHQTRHAPKIGPRFALKHRALIENCGASNAAPAPRTGTTDR